MPIPVPVPAGPLTVTDDETANGEALLAAFAQLTAGGTAGASTATPGVVIPILPNPNGGEPATAPLTMTTAERQVMYRHLCIAMAHLLVPKADTSTTSTANKVPRADAQGHIDYQWLVQDIWNETPSGAVNSSNKVYTTANPFRAGTTRVYLNGVRQKPVTHYTESGASTITFVSAPSTGAYILVDYSR